MANKAAPTVLRQLRFVVASWKEDTRTDVELLRRFVQSRDEQAFTTLVGRHSELVWGVCLRVLRNPADAEDALQATFLRLARDAKRILNKETIGGWLFRVARDCAVDLQRAIIRQRRIEERVAEVAQESGDSTPSGDLRVLLDDELAQLPQSERAVLVLCCLEGRTYASAALELGCSTAAVHRRLLRAQRRLRGRFARHGAAAGVLAAVMLGTVSPCASAAPPAALARTVEAGLSVAQTGLVPETRAGTLAATAPQTAHPSRFALTTLTVATVLVGCVCAALTAPAEPAGFPQPTPPVSRPAGPAPAKPHTLITGVIRGPSGEPVAGAAVAALARRPFGHGERGLRDDLLATATTDASGQFALRVPDDFDTWFAGRVVTVRASAPNRAPITQPIRTNPAPAAIELTLAPASALHGRLLDEAGHPAVGVHVEVVRVGDAVAEPVIGRPNPGVPPAWPDTVLSQSDGTFTLPALGSSANVWVRVVDSRFALDTFRVDAAQTPGRTEWRLAPARPLLIEVRAADTGAVLPGTRVTVITDRVAAHPHFCATEHGILGPRSVPADIDSVTDAHGRVRVALAPGDRGEVLVHPPATAGPYVGVRSHVTVIEDANEQRLVVRVPLGRWVTGTVADARGKPLARAAVHWGRETAELPEWKDTVLLGRDAITRTGADGTFKLAVLPGACSVRVYGPTPDFEAVSAKLPGTANTTLFAHHIARIEVPERGEVPPIRVALRAAQPVSGAIELPASATGPGSAFLLASGRVSPVRGYAAIPLPVRDGAFTVPGCRVGFTTRAYLLDPVARVGRVIDVTTESAVPKANLLPCGALRLRVVDSAGQPKAGHEVNVALLVERDRPNNSNGAPSEPVADAQPVEWFDATNYPTRPKTDAAGRVELLALVPGARYVISVGSGAGKVAVGKFTIEPGQTVTVPDVVLPGPHEGGSR
jgi:RNA polymerase sigma factor (sigma-70 family)